MDKVLVIAPHPDDEVLGCGGTIARYAAEGNKVDLCIVTKAYPPDWDKSELIIRMNEALEAGKILGIREIYFLGLPTVRLDTIPMKKLIGLVAEVVNKTRPNIVYCPHRGDVNKDHRLVFEATMVATRPRLDSTVRKVLCYETLSETEWAAPVVENAFMPNVWVDISQTLEIKLQAMSEYKLELKEYPHPRSLEAINHLARLRGSAIGVKAAEASMLIREIIK